MKLVEERFCFADSLYGEHPNLIYRLAHEFAGETDVISITQSLKEALLYNTETEAQTKSFSNHSRFRPACPIQVMLLYDSLDFSIIIVVIF